MDPLTTALLGAVSKLADRSVSDAYQVVKEAIRRRLGAGNSLSTAVEAVEGHPDSPGAAEHLHREVVSSGALEHPELAALSAHLSELVGRAGGGTHVSQVTVGNRNRVVGINYGSVS